MIESRRPLIPPPVKRGSERGNLQRLQITIQGIVQGVGFRPFIYRVAKELGLGGWVSNTMEGVLMDVEGHTEALDRFLHRIQREKPPQSFIETLDAVPLEPVGYEAFEIRHSVQHGEAIAVVSPDIASCPMCVREILDPQDRRYRYPFTNCTNCGPRFTIIEDIPYDRPRTTMREFRMCPACEAEYDDPTNRRFHAQPNACPTCGPSLQWVAPPAEDSGFQKTISQISGDREILREAGRLLRAGGILALKGLGGFQLACDATNPETVKRLRQRKHRSHKPFAVMMGSTEEVRRHCRVTAEEQGLLESPSAPIVLLEWLPSSSLAPEVAPGRAWLGVMLPYTPLHHLLLGEAQRPLVMTSGNRAEEPIAKDNEEALSRLWGIADAFLLHDRRILSRCDDSVWFVPIPGRAQPVRRARGHAPYPIRFSWSLGKVLACGAHLKNTFCLTRHEQAFLSPHIGDLENLETLEHFQSTLRTYERLFRCRPEAVACDCHPDYLSSQWGRQLAQKKGLPLYEIQHHHAHVAACMADNDWPPLRGPVLGVALDGTGYGPDGNIWGGEFLVADYKGFRRVGHLQYLPLPGGETAIRKPLRLALAYCLVLLKQVPDLPTLAAVSEEERGAIERMVGRKLNTPWTSSCGRLFDAVSALSGVCLEASFEGQPAMELESAAAHLHGPEQDDAYPFSLQQRGDVYIIQLQEMFRALVDDLIRGTSPAIVSGRFHATIASMVAEMCERIRSKMGLNTVALSGGCFQNRILFRYTSNRLEGRGFEVLMHSQVPCNDGGLSLGQAAIAAAKRQDERGSV